MLWSSVSSSPRWCLNICLALPTRCAIYKWVRVSKLDNVTNILYASSSPRPVIFFNAYLSTYETNIRRRWRGTRGVWIYVRSQHCTNRVNVATSSAYPHWCEQSVDAWRYVFTYPHRRLGGRELRSVKMRGWIWSRQIVYEVRLLRHAQVSQFNPCRYPAS